MYRDVILLMKEISFSVSILQGKLKLSDEERYLLNKGEWRKNMLFCSMEFIFIFLPIVLFVYYAVPAKCRNLLLFFASLVFYIYGERQYVYILLISMTVNYVSALVMEKLQSRKKRKVLLTGTLLLDFSTLFIFKYAGFALLLPLGISFYTFQLASYVIDVYWRKVHAEKNFIRFGTYLCMFPQLIAGPIVKYSDMEKQLKRRKYRQANLEEGAKLFTLGLASKMLLANEMGAFWNKVQVIGFESISTPMAWLGAISYTFQIYFDFNGYSLMAMGLCRMLGFKIKPNFDNPYLSKSLTEFWRRWHITLGNWFREYIYIPLGGNRNGRLKWVRNLFVVWLLTGIWHGADWNFWLWGVFLFVILLLEKTLYLRFLEKSKILSRIYMAVLIPISWMIFAITNIREMGIYLGRMFGIGNAALAGNMLNSEIIAAFKSCGIQWLLCIIFILPFSEKWYKKYKNKWIGIILQLCLFWASVYQIIYTKSNPFLYFRF